jgi:hypothetical protein
MVTRMQRQKNTSFARFAVVVTGILAGLVAAGPLPAVAQERAAPVFVNGQAQVVPAFADSSQWIRQRLWVETEFDSDGDGRHDRVHVDVTRPRQTDTEGLKVPVIYASSDRDFTLWPKPGTELTIDLDASLLTLPVVGGAATATRAFGAPR